ncbi:MAG TPA: hypothetical protein VNN72_23995, partial [Polyangiaceae bacterium]|nr:hypothetical protein [Polyangiaceae bacterium]
MASPFRAKISLIAAAPRLLRMTPAVMHANLLRMSEMRGAVSIARQYPVRARLEAWELPEGTVPQSVPHDHAAEHLRRVLDAFAA